MNASAKTQTGLDFQEHTLLIVDDNPTNLGVMVDFLERYGFTILVARDGESALEKVRYGQPDLILLDVMMPGIDGFETCRRLKADQTTQDIPVIFMTALTSTEEKVKGFEIGAADYVTKPLQQEEVLARITNHLRLRNLAFELQNANDKLAQQATKLTTVAEMSLRISAMKEPLQMLQTVVDLTKESFDLYHAHIYLLNESPSATPPAKEGVLVLAVGTGDIGRQMVAEGWSIPLDQERSLVAQAARTRQEVLVNNVRENPYFLTNPLLPKTRSEVSVPINVGDMLLGVLDVQADSFDRFSDDDVWILTTLAAQVAVALQNTRSFERSERAFKELNALTRRLTREGWDSYLAVQKTEMGYAYDLQQVLPLHQVKHRHSEPSTFSKKPGEHVPKIEQPLMVQGETVGQLAMSDPQVLTADATEIVEAIAARLSAHVENLRLAEQTQGALSETEVLYKASDRIMRATSIYGILEALVTSSPLQRLDRANFMFFEHPWADKMPEFMTSTAVWVREGQEQRARLGTRLSLVEIPGFQRLKRDEPVLYRDVMTDEQLDPILRQRILERLKMRSMISFPLVAGGQWFGTLNGQAKTPMDITEDEIRQISNLVSQAATAIQNQRLFEQTRMALEEANIFRQFVEAAGQGIGFATLDGKIQYINPALARLVQEEDRDAVVGKSIMDFYSEEMKQLILHEVLPTVMKEGQWTGETALLSSRGNETPVIDSYFLLRDENGEPLYLADVATDITERKVAEAEREQLLADVQEAYRQFVRREWEQFLGERYQGNWRIEHQQADLTNILTNGDRGPSVTTPISVRGEAIGTLSLQDIDPDRQWTAEEIALVQTVSEQLGLTIENLRLFEDTQKQATREQLAREITDKMRTSPDIDAIIQTGLSGLAKALGVSRTYVKLTPQTKQRASSAAEIESAREHLKRHGYKSPAGFSTDQPLGPLPPKHTSESTGDGPDRPEEN